LSNPGNRSYIGELVKKADRVFYSTRGRGLRCGLQQRQFRECSGDRWHWNHSHFFWHRREAGAQSLGEGLIQTAKEILAKILHARSEDVEEMIHMRVEEKLAVGLMPEADNPRPIDFFLGEHLWIGASST